MQHPSDSSVFAAPDAYLAFDDGGLAAVPEAIAAYVDFHQHQCL
jgi:hypothetical protein